MFHQGHPLWTPSFSLLGCLTSRPSYWLRFFFFFFFFCRSTSERYFIGDTLAITVSQKTSRLACAIHCVVVDQLSRIAFPSESNLLSLVCVVSPAAALSLYCRPPPSMLPLDSIVFYSLFFLLIYFVYILYCYYNGGGIKRLGKSIARGAYRPEYVVIPSTLLEKNASPPFAVAPDGNWRIAKRAPAGYSAQDVKI